MLGVVEGVVPIVFGGEKASPLDGYAEGCCCDILIVLTKLRDPKNVKRF